MKIAFFDCHGFERATFIAENEGLKAKHEITYFEARLTETSAILAAGYPCVCAFVNDCLNRETLRVISKAGTRLIALRSAGFNHVDLEAARDFGLRVVRVPEYSPYAVAEHAVALVLSLNRKIHRAYNRVREGNFSLEGLVGFDMYKKSVGIVGTGRIGSVMARIMIGFGCEVLAYDQNKNPDLLEMGVQYLELDEVLKESDIISLHVPLTPKTRHILNEKSFSLMKPGVMVINTSRGALIDTPALIQFLKSGHIGYAGLDVYEEEEGIFFKNLSDQILQDDQLARLLTFPNALLTSHQAFLTREALANIAQTTLQNISGYEMGSEFFNEVSLESHVIK
ncbi:MAG: 2-hydroxyacid dehydrogenase [Bdellovibrionales bacterium]|nr:2-hydroxyacid dehydrogenase [Bdellovibrionales bacterium]